MTEEEAQPDDETKGLRASALNLKTDATRATSKDADQQAPSRPSPQRGRGSGCGAETRNQDTRKPPQPAPHPKSGNRPKPLAPPLPAGERAGVRGRGQRLRNP